MPVRCISLLDLDPEEFRKMRHRTTYSGTTQSPQRGLLRWQQIYLLLREISDDYCISKKRVTQAESSKPSTTEFCPSNISRDPPNCSSPQSNPSSNFGAKRIANTKPLIAT